MRATRPSRPYLPFGLFLLILLVVLGSITAEALEEGFWVPGRWPDLYAKFVHDVGMVRPICALLSLTGVWLTGMDLIRKSRSEASRVANQANKSE